jgi:hypothetical protein
MSYIENVLQKALKNVLNSFVENVQNYDTSLKTQDHKQVMQMFIRDDFSMKGLYQDILTIYGGSIEKAITEIKTIASIRLIYPRSYEAWDERQMTMKPDMVLFLARYLVKSRATYMYIYMLFIRKQWQLADISKQLQEKYNILIEKDPKNDLASFLFQLQQNILSQISDKELKDKIQTIFTNKTQKYENVFSDLGGLIETINNTTAEFRDLVINVIPRITNWQTIKIS